MADAPPPTRSALTRDLLALRETLARELDTINEYELLIEQAASPEVKALLAHLRDEEKEHVAECTEYIRRLDPVQDALFRADADALVAGKNRGDGIVTPPPGRVAMARGLTVGSLKRREGA